MFLSSPNASINLHRPINEPHLHTIDAINWYLVPTIGVTSTRQDEATTPIGSLGYHKDSYSI